MVDWTVSFREATSYIMIKVNNMAKGDFGTKNALWMIFHSRLTG